jgi:hypothetical protein
MTELWKAIPGLGDKYEVSNHGRVRTLPYLARFTHWRTGAECFRQTKVKILAQQVQNAGYALVHLWHEDKRTALTVHRLVAAAFCPGFFEAADVNHKDGVKTNNHVDNLEWITRSENHYHAVKLRLNKAAIPVVDPVTRIKYDSLQQAARILKADIKRIRRDFIRLDDLTADLV